MKRSRICMALVLVLIMLFSVMATGCSKAEPIPQDTVVMTVNGKDITMAEYRYYYLGLKADYDGGDDSYWKNNDSGREGLKKLVQMYLTQEAAYDKLLADNGYSATVQDKLAVDQNIEEIKKLYETDEEYQALLLANNLTEEMYRDMLTRNEVLYRYLFEYNVKNKSDKMEKYLADFVRAKHILVMFSDGTSSSGSEETHTKEEAKKIIDEIKVKIAGGADFDALIKEYGEDPGMETNPDGYVFTEGEMVEQFEKAAFALKDGEISDVVETTYGYHIIQRLEMDEAFQRKYFSTIFNDDEFFEDFEAEVEKLMEKIEVVYSDIYDQVDIETVA